MKIFVIEDKHNKTYCFKRLNDKDTCTASMDRCSIDTVSGAMRILNRVEPKASGSLWISPAKNKY